MNNLTKANNAKKKRYLAKKEVMPASYSGKSVLLFDQT